MFATHLAPPLQPSLASHFFGRLIARTPPARAVAAPAMPAEPEALEDECPDLAQRVRELGEW